MPIRPPDRTKKLRTSSLFRRASNVDETHALQQTFTDLDPVSLTALNQSSLERPQTERPCQRSRHGRSRSLDGYLYNFKCQDRVMHGEANKSHLGQAEENGIMEEASSNSEQTPVTLLQKPASRSQDLLPKQSDASQQLREGGATQSVVDTLTHQISECDLENSTPDTDQQATFVRCTPISSDSGSISSGVCPDLDGNEGYERDRSMNTDDVHWDSFQESLQEPSNGEGSLDNSTVDVSEESATGSSHGVDGSDGRASPSGVLEDKNYRHGSDTEIAQTPESVSISTDYGSVMDCDAELVTAKQYPKRFDYEAVINRHSMRSFLDRMLLSSPRASPSCMPTPNDGAKINNQDVGLQTLDREIWSLTASYLSFRDVKNLRLVGRHYHNIVTPIMLRNTVVKFGKKLFEENESIRTQANHSGLDTCSLLRTYGSCVNRFAIALEYDLIDLANANPKINQKMQNAWFGSFPWPLPHYPRFPELRETEDLLDTGTQLLEDVIRQLDKATELALSIDSGHGWLEGGDISDLQLLEQRDRQGTKVFGRAFEQDDVWLIFSRDVYFKCAQQNSIDEALKNLFCSSPLTRREEAEREYLKNIAIQPYDSYRVQRAQHDYDEHDHTGGKSSTRAALQPAHVNLVQLPNPIPPFNIGPHALFPFAQNGPLFHQNHPAAGGLLNQAAAMAGQFGQAQQQVQQEVARRRLRRDIARAETQEPTKRDAILPAWPIIFNGHNIAAQVHGQHLDLGLDPRNAPVLPGSLTEAQAQWLLELSWTQKTFLSSYTTAVVANQMALRNVHTLNIAKISSGLLDSLNLKEFWTSLPELRSLRLLVSPDWRQEHVINDKSFDKNMLISPMTASTKFVKLLSTHISQLEKLSHLRIGYVGGGENAVGMFARNQHVLPAPIVADVRPWLLVHKTVPDNNLMLRIDHVQNLEFENCWFSPQMLETFMDRAKDTSLHNLKLESVSLTGRHSPTIALPLTTIGNNLHCAWDKEDWLREPIPGSACWTQVLDRITPGCTMSDRKIARGLLTVDPDNIPEKEFRGNIQKITLISCGYVKIDGLTDNEFNQNALVLNRQPSGDAGIQKRRESFEQPIITSDSLDGRPPHRRPPFDFPANIHPILRPNIFQPRPPPAGSIETLPLPDHKHVMMSTIDPLTKKPYFGLGRLTSCVHPVEKRILECAWDMEFGWGDNMKRWAAVDDGFFEGGTGRFSGVISRD